MSDSYNEKSEDKAKIRDRIISTTPIVRFGERLKEAMNGITNVELAKRTGMSEATIRKYIAGKIFPTIDSLAIVADACGVSFSWLAFGEEPDESNSSKYIEQKDDFNGELLTAFNRLSHSERELVVEYIYREGINNLVRIAASHTPVLGNDMMLPIVEALPLRPVLKSAIKIGLANNGEYDKEILRILEKIESSSQSNSLAKDKVG
ncbi:helix-turn-helix domain-containing protein [Providencia alcalifaciens]|uniref:Helix-turn-helix domain-containing protein n=1 Tax=Providencia alcalifaciens TaxID=126385 RepID=A0AAW9V979_9GAMM|nr:helix-turn-helix domain-containing protein [Providencia alcalifaciens]